MNAAGDPKGWMGRAKTWERRSYLPPEKRDRHHGAVPVPLFLRAFPPGLRDPDGSALWARLLPRSFLRVTFDSASKKM